MLRYLARYTHRVAIANSRLLAFEGKRVTFRYKDYRADGVPQQKVMTVSAFEFIRRFLLHVVPDGFHRIRHYGFLANAVRVASIAKARALLGAAAPQRPAADTEPDAPVPCPRCGGRLVLIEIFERGAAPKSRPTTPSAFQCDTS